MRNIIPFTLFLFFITGCAQKKIQQKNDFIIASGQMPNLVKDSNNNIHVVYGSGDSILYVYSTDNANSFSKPVLISVLPHLYSFAMRGPQIAATAKNIVVTACTDAGNIYTFYKTGDTNWAAGKKVNDVDSVAKEGLMALSADGDNLFAVWLDLRETKRNKIYGTKSTDGGRTWSANKMIYTSPDSSVCECCKPSVIIKGNQVLVMFRNWINGNRDLYLIKSTDGGITFNQAEQIGTGNWKLNGCPMDGGGVTISDNGNIQTVWRRQGKIFSAVPGMTEKEIGEGKGCTMETVNNQNIYAWTENGDIMLTTSNGKKQALGKGYLPVLKSLNNETVICVWEEAKQIHASVIPL